MTLQPTTFRVSEFAMTESVLNQLRSNLRAISENQQRIASGKRYDRPSDAPLSVRRIISWERWIQRYDKFEANIELATSRLGASESTLDEFGELIARARNLGLQQLNSTATDETRALAAVEISSLIDEAVTLANRQFGDRFLFGGSHVDRAPFERAGDYVTYRGDERSSRVEIAVSMVFEDSVTGAQAFGGMSTEIVGRVDLDPVVGTGTRLADLNGGRGVAPGTIEIRDGLGGTELVDLSGAQTIEDVLDRINRTGFAVAAVNADANGIAISKGGADLDVLDVNGGSTARDLGIAAVGAGPTVIGSDVDPILRRTTSLADLRGGIGVELSGVVITNGNLSATLDFSAHETLEDVINAINGSGTAVVADINRDGRGISVRSVLSGADLVISENGGDTASNFGLMIPSDELPLTMLHGGLGVETQDGADFRITLSDGTTLDLEIESATTLGDVAELINSHPDAGGRVLAEVVPLENRLRLTDLAGGPDELSVDPINGAFTSAQLGIEGTATGGVLEGTDLAPGGVRLVSAFDGFALLHRGLAASDVAVMGEALRALEAADTRLLETQAELGGRIRRLEISQRRTELESFEIEELLSLEGDTDLAEAIVTFQQQQTVYQAALQTAARLVQPSLLDFLG